MAYFVRYTDTPEEDIKRGYSVHGTPYSAEDYSIEEAVNECNMIGFDVEEDDLVIVNGLYCVKCSGLCCYEIEEDQIDEMKNSKDSKYNHPAYIFEGEYIEGGIDDGCIAELTKLIK